MRLKVAVCVVLLLTFRAAGAAEPTISPEPALPEITGGQQVTIHGKDFPPDTRIDVYLRSGTGSEKPIKLDATRVNAETLTFPLPPEQVSPGRYLVSIGIAQTEIPVPGDLRVLADTAAPVHIDAIYPVTAYPTEHEGFDFEIVGQHLATIPQDNHIIVVGRGAVPVGSAAECDAWKTTSEYEKTCLYVDPGMETYKLRVVNFPRAKYDGPVKIQVQIGNGSNISNPQPLIFSRVSERTALLAAVVVFAAIMFTVVRLVWTGVGDHQISGKRFGPWTAFFLDKETNTYSLSKFQLLVWTSVFVFGYEYLFLCRLLIQWKFELPPPPEGLPAMLALSVGTVVAASGATEARGSKGSGPIYPSFADFVSTGGLVVGERFQFFVWTLVGALGFLSTLLLADPASLVQLPPIPDNFLYLMGISSAGYLGGKLTRKPGPVVRALTISSANPFTVRLQGENLAKDATIQVDDKPLRPDDEYTIAGTPQVQAAEPSFCNELSITLRDPEPYLEGVHKLTLVNRDGQSAAVQFPLDPLTIDSVDSVTHGAPAATVKVTGKNFDDGTHATWKGAGNDTKPAPLVKISSTELNVTVTPVTLPGTGTLTILSAMGLKASKQVTVV